MHKPEKKAQYLTHKYSAIWIQPAELPKRLQPMTFLMTNGVQNYNLPHNVDICAGKMHGIAIPNFTTKMAAPEEISA